MEAQEASQTPTASGGTPSAAPPAAPNGTAPSGSGDAQQGAPAEGTFTRVDPRTLPKELKSVYDNMLKDYTEKTTHLADERKKFSDYDTVKTQAEAWAKVQQDPRFQSWVGGLNDPPKPAAEEEGLSQEMQALWLEAQTDPAKAVEFHRKVAQQETATLRKEQEKLREEAMLRDADTTLKTWSESKDPKTGELVHKNYERLEKLGFFEHAVTKYLEKNPNTTMAESMNVLEAAYQTAQKMYDEVYQEGYQGHIREAEQKANNSTERATVGTNSSEEVMDYDKAKNLTVQEAVALARRGNV